jgi:hypothetical protein
MGPVERTPASFIGESKGTNETERALSVNIVSAWHRQAPLGGSVLGAF